MSKNVIVIGGGLAGLVAANFAAKAAGSDCTVTLFEKSRALGGRAMTSEKNGILFNLGPHALYRGGHAYNILRELGVAVTGGIPKVDGTVAIDGGRKHTLPGSPLSLLTTSLFGVAAKLEAAGLLRSLPNRDATKFNHMTVREWLDKEIRHDDLRRLIEAFFRLGTYTNDPERQSAGLALAQFQMALKSSVLYADGGWQALVNELRANAELSGVKMVAESRVVKIQRHAGRATGVTLADGSEQPADAIIIAASPAEAAELVDSQTLGEIAASAIPVKAACLDIALERLPKPETTFALGIDRPLYLSVHSAAARLAPEGNAVIHLLKYLGAKPPDDPKAVEHELEELLDLAQPGWQPLLIERRFMPSLTVVNALATAEQGGLTGRPGPAVPGVEGLFVAGDWVGAEGWLADASAASGKRAAELAIYQPVKQAMAA